MKGFPLRVSTTGRSGLTLLILSSLGLALRTAALPAGMDSGVDAVMARVVASNRATVRGVVGFQADAQLRVGAGFYHRLQQERRWFVLGDGMLVKTGLRPGSDGPFGKEPEKQSHDPWGPYSDEYRFTEAPCPRCGPGLMGVAFQSMVHDTQHSKGVMIVDVDRERIVRETQEPYVLQGSARTGTIEIEFGDTALGWLPIQLRGTFTGNVGPFSGAASLTEAFDDYRRYPSPEAAVGALDS